MEVTVTTTTIKRIILILCLVCPAVYIHGQETDFGIWMEFNTGFGLLKKLEASFSASQRTFNNTSQLNQGFVEAGLQYRINRNFSVTGSYRLIKKIEDDSKYYYRHKMFIDLKYSQPVGNMKISARFRMHRATKTYIEDEEDLIPYYYGRIRLKSEYDVPSFPVNPFVYVESFSPLLSDSGFEISKFRTAAGTEVKISRCSSFEAGYIYQWGFRKNMVNTHIMLLSYNLKF